METIFIIPNKYVPVSATDFIVRAQHDFIETMGASDEWKLSDGDIPVSLSIPYFEYGQATFIVPFRCIENWKEGDVVTIPFSQPLEVRCLQVGSTYGRFGRFEEALHYVVEGYHA